MTIWRDLKVLDEKGLLKKVHGGAVKIDFILKEEPSFEEKITTAAEKKEAIGKYVAENLIRKGDIISLGAGSTILKMLPYLKRKDITILTNGLQNIVFTSEHMKSINLIASGGSIRYPALVFVGPVAENFFTHYRSNKVFLSGTGLTVKDGIMDPHPLDVSIKKAMYQGAEQKIFLMDSSKINQTSLATTIKLNEIDLLITDDGAPLDFIQQLEDLGIKFHIVSKK